MSFAHNQYTKIARRGARHLQGAGHLKSAIFGIVLKGVTLVNLAALDQLIEFRNSFYTVLAG